MKGWRVFVREDDDILSYASLCDDFISISNLPVSSQSDAGPHWRVFEPAGVQLLQFK